MKSTYRTVALIAAVAALGLVTAGLNTEYASGAAAIPDHAKDWEFVGNSQCKMCHNGKDTGAQWDTWHNAKHAKALDLLKTDEAEAVAKEMGLTMPAAESPECLKCHVTGYDAEAKAAPAKIKMAEGVQCESCHGPASEHLKVSKTLKFSPDKISEIDIMATLLQADEATCRGCHNDSSPTWKDDRYTLESGESVGFDFEQAWKKIAHDYPEGVLEEKYGDAYPHD